MKKRRLDATDFVEFVDELCDPSHTDGLGDDRICSSCADYIRRFKIPPLSLAKYPQLKFPHVPDVLKNATVLEERFFAPRIAFLQLVTLRRNEQNSVKGRVVNVPSDVERNVSILPRLSHEIGVIPVALKKKHSFKSNVFFENVRLDVIARGTKALENSPIYKEANIEIDMSRIPLMMDLSQQDEASVPNVSDDSDFEELDLYPVNIPQEETVLVKNDNSEAMVFCPGEGLKPLPLFLDPHAEAMTFPRLYGGELREKPAHLTYQKFANSELRRFDRRCAADPVRLFYYAIKLRAKKIGESMAFCLRKSQGNENKYTAADCLSKVFLESFHTYDSGYQIFLPDRGSPAFWQRKLYELIAMIEQIGPPVLFLTLSPAETQWPELLVILKKNVDRLEITEDEALALPYEEKTRLIKSDPVTCALYFDYKTRKNFQLMTTSEIGIFMEHHVVDYYYRVEFQQRGSPHIHALLWLHNAPSLVSDDSEENRRKVIEFADKFISCSSDTGDRITVERQHHKHSFTCKKKNKKTNISDCRFGIPFFPMKETVYLDPLKKSELSSEQKKVLSENLAKVKSRLNELYKLTSNPFDAEVEDFDNFLINLGLSLEDYILTVRYSLSQKSRMFYKRAPKDVRINPYNKDLSELHRANMDIQIINNKYGLTEYVTSYMLKGQRSLSQMLRELNEEIAKGNYSIREQFKLMVTKFLDCSEFGAQEAVYYILSLCLSNSTRLCVFINTGRPEKRVLVILPDKILKTLPEDCKDVYQRSDLDRYINRPDELRNMCLADFVATFNYSKRERKPGNRTCNKNDDQDEGNIWSEEENIDDEVEHQLPRQTKEPTYYKLKDDYGYIYRRKKPKVIRYVTFKLASQEDDYYREQLMLFMPWTDEETDLIQVDPKAKYEENKPIVKANRKRYKYNDDEATEDLSTLINENLESEDEDEENVDEEGDDQQNPADGFEVLRDRTDEGDILFDIGYETNTKNDDTNYIPIPHLLPKERYDDTIRSLNDKQQRYLLHVLNSFKLGTGPIYECVIGSAGVGKSRLIEALEQTLVRFFNDQPDEGKENQQLDTRKVILCAPTGRAAFNIRGSTIHSVAILQYNQCTFGMAPLNDSVRNTAYCRLRDVKLIIMDEVSMVGSRMFAYVDQRLRQIFQRPDLPFAGISIILFGDFNQVRPVGDAYIFNPNPANPYGPLIGNPLWDMFKFYKLTEIMRQKDDAEFARALDNLAEGQLTPEQIKMFKSRQTKKADIASLPAVRLFKTNVDVDAYNNSVLRDRKTKGHDVIEFPAIDFVLGKVSEDEKQSILKHLRNQPTVSTFGLPSLLKLCTGIKYLVSVNVRTEDGIANGSVGVLQHIETSEKGKVKRVWLHFDNPYVGKKTRSELKKNVYTRLGIDPTLTPIEMFSRNLKARQNSPILVLRKQFPIVPAEAMTIHKSQGSTYNSVVVNIKPRMDRSLLYVACSRATSLSGLHIIGEFKAPAPIPPDHPLKKEITSCLLDKAVNMRLHFLQDFPGNFSVIFHNVNSLRKHHLDVVNDRCFVSAKIIIIVETWLKPFENFDIPGYYVFHRSDVQRDVPHAHGIMVFIREGLEANLLFQYNNESPKENCNIVAIEVEGWYVCGVYRAPSNTSHSYWHNLEEMLKTVTRINHKRVVVCGDFNVNLRIEDEERAKTKLVKFFKSFGLQLNSPSEPSTDAGTQIDLCFTNEKDIFSCYYESLFSPHKPIVCIEGYTPEIPLMPLPIHPGSEKNFVDRTTKPTATEKKTKNKTVTFPPIQSKKKNNVLPETNKSIVIDTPEIHNTVTGKDPFIANPNSDKKGDYDTLYTLDSSEEEMSQPHNAEYAESATTNLNVIAKSIEQMEDLIDKCYTFSTNRPIFTFRSVGLNIYKSDLNSLRLEMSDDEVAKTKKAIKAFVKSWLTDNVIDAYLYQIKCAIPHFNFLTCDNSHYLCRLQRVPRVRSSQTHNYIDRYLKKNMSSVKNTLLTHLAFPLNTGNHYVACLIRLDEQLYTIVDPMKMTIEEKYKLVVKQFAEKYVSHRNSKGQFKWVDIHERPYQTDEYNCGVFVCKYIEEFAEHKGSLENLRINHRTFSPNEFRIKIFNVVTLRSNVVENPDCAHKKSVTGSHLLDTSGDLTSDDNVVENPDCEKKNSVKGFHLLDTSDDLTSDDNMSQPEHIPLPIQPLDKSAQSDKIQEKPNIPKVQRRIKIPPFVNSDNVSCYSNAIIQAIFYSNAVLNETLVMAHSSSLRELAQLYASYSSGNLNTLALRQELGYPFTQHAQQDANEFFQSLIESYEQISQAFEIEIENRIKCSNCEYLNITTTVEKILRLHIPRSKSFSTLDDLIKNEYSSTSTILGTTCDLCKSKGTYTEQFRIQRASSTIMVQLILWDEWQNKIHNVKLSNLPSSKIKINGADFGMVAAIFHEGDTPRSGHYTTVLRNADTEEYIKADDTRIKELTTWPSDSKGVYMMVFSRE